MDRQLQQLLAAELQRRMTAASGTGTKQAQSQAAGRAVDTSNSGSSSNNSNQLSNTNALLHSMLQLQTQPPSDPLGVSARLLQHLFQTQQQQQLSAALRLQQLLQGNTAPALAPSVSLLAQLLGQMQHQQQQQQQQQSTAPAVPPPAAVSTTQRTQVSAAAAVTQAARNDASSVARADTKNDLGSKPAKEDTAFVTSDNVTAFVKRQAFLKKRSRTAALAIRKSAKKAKTGSTNGISTSPPVQNSNEFKNAFVVSDHYCQGDMPDLLFPWRLHDVLDDSEKNENIKTIISWNNDGASFEIYDEAKFQNEIMAQYFEERAWDSFSEALSSWGFVRFTSGAQKGAFIHRLFVNGRRALCKQMRIQGKAVSELMKCHGQFLGRFHALLCYAEKSGQTSVVSWSPDGKKFTVNDPNAFMNDIFPMYFDAMTYGSLEQKLKRWGFSRNPARIEKAGKETKLTNNASYWHPHFQKAKVPLVARKKSQTKKLSKVRPDHNFLIRLRAMLRDSSADGNQLTVSWLRHGKAFMIYDRSHFSEEILPAYFKTKFTSFRQALRSHGFAQMGGTNWDEGAFYHKLFIRDEPLLCQGLTQAQMKKAMPDYVPLGEEPNFYPEQKHHDLALLDVANSIVSLKDFRAWK